MKVIFYPLSLLFLLYLCAPPIYAQYVPAMVTETHYGTLAPYTCRLNDVGTDTRDATTGVGDGFGSPFYANYLNVTVNSCRDNALGAPGFYWDSSHGTNGSSPLPADAQDPDVVLISPGPEAAPADIHDIWAIAVYYSASNGGYCMSVSEFNTMTYVFAPMSAPTLIQPFVPTSYSPHVNIDANNIGRYGVVMQLNDGIVSKTQTLITLPISPTNPIFQPNLIEPDIAALSNSAHIFNIVAVAPSRNRYKAYTRGYFAGVSSPYLSPPMPELYEPRIAAPKAGLDDEYAITALHRYSDSGDEYYDILLDINEGGPIAVNAGIPGYPPAIHQNNINFLPCLSYSYHLSGTLKEQVSLGWYTEKIAGISPVPNQTNTFIGLDIKLPSMAPTTPSAYLDISILTGSNNISAMALSGRYTSWLKSAAFTYADGWPNFGRHLKWKYLGSGFPGWKSATEANSLPESPENLVSLSPNPAHDEVIIAAENMADGYSYEVMNQLGQTMLKNDSRNPKAKVSVGDWPAGLYFVKVQGRGSREVRISKFIKQ